MTSQFVDTSFGKFAYEDVGNPGSTIVLLHGGAANLRAWDGVVRNLSRTNRCISLDLPSHGETTIDQLNFANLADAILKFCEQLSARRPFLVGHSFGGLVAATTALAHPEQFQAVMAVDPYLSNREVRRSHRSLKEALDEIREMTWPWQEVRDLEPEVERCFNNLQQPRRYPENSMAMIRRGYRLQDNGMFVRYPRKDDEMRAIEANWSVDLDQIYQSLPCPLSIAIATTTATMGLGSIDERRALLGEIDALVDDFESTEFECGHDIPGFMPEELSAYVDTWTRKLSQYSHYESIT
jgi:pimeloyl-ACP methyl ester carboxylesterase